MNAVRAAKLPVTGGQAAAPDPAPAAPCRAAAQVIALDDYRARAYPEPGARPRPGTAAPLRLTRRGRIAVAAAAALLVSGLSLAAAVAARPASNAVSPAL